jgi:hypothetical protein
MSSTVPAPAVRVGCSGNEVPAVRVAPEGGKTAMERSPELARTPSPPHVPTVTASAGAEALNAPPHGIPDSSGARKAMAVYGGAGAPAAAGAAADSAPVATRPAVARAVTRARRVIHGSWG